MNARKAGDGDQALLKNGDDRAAFLRHSPPDLLYFWWAFNKYDLIYFTLAELDPSIAASSDGTPAFTSKTIQKKGKRKRATPDSEGTKKCTVNR